MFSILQTRHASIWLSMFSVMVSSNMTTPIIGVYAAQRLNADPVTVGAIYGAQTVTAFISRIPAVWLSRRIGLDKVMLLGLTAVSAGSLIYAIANQPYHLMVGGVVRGVGSGAYHPTVLSYMYSESGDGGRGFRSLGYMLTASPLGMILGPVVGATVFTVAGYTTSFIAAAAIPMVGSAGLYLLSPSNGEMHPSFSFRQVARRSFTTIMITRLIINYVAGTISAFLPLMAHTMLGLAEQHIFLLFSLAAAFNLTARFVAGTVSARLGEAQMLRMGSFLVAVSALLVTLSSEASVLAAMAVYGVGVGYFVVSSVALVGRILSPEVRTLGFALMTSMIDLGNGLGNLISGLILGLYDFTAVFLTATILGFFGTLLDLVITRR
ncbi:MAG: MFS transporter [Nitrososphaerota archaeon]